MMQSPDRGRIKRKWRVARDSGPLALCSDLLLKRLLQHCWPCRTEWINIDNPNGYVIFLPSRGQAPHTKDFGAALKTAVANLNSDLGIHAVHEWDPLLGETVYLVGNHEITKWGVLRREKLPRPCKNSS